MSAPGQPRVLLLHNRYRFEGGEERSLALQQRALANAGIAHRLLARHSAETPRLRAATALLRGGAAEEEVAAAVRELGADVVHDDDLVRVLGALVEQRVERHLEVRRPAARGNHD